MARAAGGTELAPELRLWRVPATEVAGLRRAGVVAISRPEQVFATAALAQQPTDPLVPLEWWRAAIGADRLDPPGAGKPVTVVDSGIDMTHPEFMSRPNTTALNPQSTFRHDPASATAC